jgi:hypothetical protein
VCRHITNRQIEDLIASKLVTPEQLRAAGLQVLGLLKGRGDLDDPVGEQTALDDLPQRARLKNG